ncbi:MAG TPA: hypothetical protein DDW52_26200, partial [Planctomycetaceae bacterium]|nr:hypothetical protein [Planctomycetaceae bacterium]
NRQIENRQIENRQIEDQQYSYTHLQGVYSLVAGSGPILFVDKGNHIVIRFGLEINSTTFGLAIITLALVAALPTLGLSYLLVVFANDFAATSVVGELERLTHECVSNSMAQQEIKQPG